MSRYLQILISMIQQHLSRIIQSLIALPLLILTISHWNQNRLGQNVINLSTVATYCIGLDYIIIFYRWFMNYQESFHYELTIIFGMVFVLCKLFEKFHPTENHLPFNNICEYNLIIIIGLNLLFVAFLMLMLFAYACRQIYRLLTETLLSASQNLEEEERTRILDMKKPFHQLKEEADDLSATCSICLMQFQADNVCILLPGCMHCFHQECIEGWIHSHSTCPYCRNNLRLSLI